MAATTIPFFHPGTELGVLETYIQELEASAHTPPVPLERAKQAFAHVRGMHFCIHEAALQVSMGQTAGDEQHQRIWQAKIAAIDQQIVDATAALHERLLELKAHRFRRFAAAMVVGAAVLRWLFQPPIDGHRPPPVLRAYIQDCAFISPGCAKAGD